MLLPGFLLLLTSALAAESPGLRVWAVSDGVRVNPVTGRLLENRPDIHRDYPAGDPRAGNLAWDAASKTVTLKSARNEFVAFQLILEAEHPQNEIDVKFARLEHSSGARLEGRNLAIFKEWYVEVRRPSTGYERSSLGPAWYPDALMPYRRARLNSGFPFSIPDLYNNIPGQKNHALWFDLYVPHEREAAPPGRYTGAIEITWKGGRDSVRVALDVWDFALPHETHLSGDIWNGSMKSMPPDEEMRYYQLARRHRFLPLIYAYRPKLEVRGAKVELDWTEFDTRLAPYLDGSAFTEKHGYWGPGYGLPVDHMMLPFDIERGGNRSSAWPVPLPAAGRTPEYESIWRDTARQVREHLDRDPNWRRISKIAFLNGLDESYNEDAYEKMLYYGRLLHEALGRGWFKYRIDGGYSREAMEKLQREVDLWVCHTVSWDSDKMEYFRKRGVESWFYGPMIYEQRKNSGCGSNTFLDLDLLVNRGIGWVGWKYRSGWVEWEFDWNAYAAWFEAENFKEPQRIYNGSGQLIYRGAVMGYSGPVPSIRLKAQRRGLQDYEYFWLLAQQTGGRAEADKLVDGIVYKRPFGQAAMLDIEIWKNNPDEWEKARIAAGERIAASRDWIARVRTDHPRLFFNRDTWPAVKARALGEEAETFQAMRAHVDEVARYKPEIRDYGREAAEAAFVHLVSGESPYAAIAEGLLASSLAYYRECREKQREVNWYSFSRISALAAYDWLFNSLSESRRKELGRALLEAVRSEQPTRARKAYPRENWGGPESGFYSTPSLLWYAGLATHRDGIDDPLAEKFLTGGYDLFMQLLRHRSNAAGDDGGSASGALNYSLAAYPWAEFNFFHTFRSATGRDLAREWPYVAYLPGYIFWNWLPGAREFGYGDAYHTVNRMPLGELNLHLSQIIQFYAGTQPESAAFAKWLSAKTPREQRAIFPFARFLLTSLPQVDPARDPEARMPMARHFENMGQTFFRSGSGPDDTYALFTAGGALEMHKQFDHNNFVICKKGFLALDSGTRPEPGQHLTHYYARTVAHNAILIHMPGEKMPRYWGNRAPEEEDLPVPNDGGQRQVLGSKVVAFETNPHYSYVAGDATATYHEDKCRLAVRQFVFLPPDHFVVFDRVVSAKPEYQKTWLLHTAAEPQLARGEFSAAHEQGKLFSRTLLPEKAALTSIGGPGRQFWSDGRNWPLPKGYRTPDTTPLLGQWRVEVSPEAARADDVFLHLIQAGDATLARMTPSQLVRKDGRVGVAFEYGGAAWELLFATEGPPAGHVTLKRQGRAALDQELTREVSPQRGLYPESPARTQPSARSGR